MLSFKEFHRPKSADETVDLLKRYQGKAKVLAGGSSLIFAKSNALDALIDLKDTGLDTFKENQDGYHLGSYLSVRSLRKSLSSQENCLYEAADRLYSRIVQNHVTVGGNCVMVYGWSDLPLATWCMGASFEILGPKGSRTLSADFFYEKHPTKTLEKDEILTRISIPKPASREASAYIKIGRDKTDEALASVAARIMLGTDGTISAARIVVGAVRALPQKFDGPSELIGQNPSTDIIKKTASAIATSTVIADTYLASSDYRRDLVSTLTADALEKAIKRAGGAL